MEYFEILKDDLDSFFEDADDLTHDIAFQYDSRTVAIKITPVEGPGGTVKELRGDDRDDGDIGKIRLECRRTNSVYALFPHFVGIMKTNRLLGFLPEMGLFDGTEIVVNILAQKPINEK